VIWYLADTIIFVLSLYLLVMLKYGNVSFTGRLMLISIYSFFIWIVISIFTKKLKVIEETNMKAVVGDLAISNFFILASLLLLVRIRPYYIDFRFLILYLILLVSLLEVVAGWFFVLYNNSKKAPFQNESITGEDVLRDSGMINKKGDGDDNPKEPRDRFQSNRAAMERLLIEETDKDVIEYVEQFIPDELNATSILSTTTLFNVKNLPLTDYEVIINLKRLNDIPSQDTFFEAVNEKLRPGGIFISWVETNYRINKEKVEKYFSRGFEVVEEREVGRRVFFVVRKVPR
jgi:hypothetical protein